MPTKDQHNLMVRPPVIVVMGHIDHGKSTLLDHIRKTDVAGGEAGGITQHIGAYQVVHTSAAGKTTPLTFLDTPGHEAFCGIRERGAQVADIAILAVSAEDGVKPQTVEAYKVIKASGIPFIVAITKIDKPNANIDVAKQSLGEHEIYVEGWGGDVPCVPVSAMTGAGISELLDMIMLVADLADFKTDPKASATGAIIESTLNTRKGISATLLLKDGTLSVGSVVVAGNAFAPVRFIENFKGEKITDATAAMPVSVLGWNTMPSCGVDFSVVDSKKEAEKMIAQYKDDARATATKATLASKSATSPLPPSSATEAPEVVTIPLIIKADVIGSLDGVRHELAKIKHDKVKLKIVSEGIGAINENDIKTAAGDTNILVIGFNADPEAKAATVIERSSIPLNVRNFSIIYELTQYVKDALAAKIPKEYIEESTGRAKILAVFSKDKNKQVLGGKVETGTISRGNDIKIIRRDTELGRGKIHGLQQAKKSVDEVREGFEFGMMIDAKIELAPGDRIEAVRTVEKLG
jgi:translation initiation factor IF-2